MDGRAARAGFETGDQIFRDVEQTSFEGLEAVVAIVYGNLERVAKDGEIHVLDLDVARGAGRKVLLAVLIVREKVLVHQAFAQGFHHRGVVVEIGQGVGVGQRPVFRVELTVDQSHQHHRIPE